MPTRAGSFKGPGPDPLLAKGDEVAYKRAIHDLILNGLEASAPGGRVTLKTSQWRGRARGCRRRVRHVASRPPSLVQTTDHNEAGGSGRGLMLAAATAATHGGSIAVESKLGKGTIVTLRLTASHRSRHGSKRRRS
jgi:signal transduction histidine kinase